VGEFIVAYLNVYSVIFLEEEKPEFSVSDPDSNLISRECDSTK